MSIWKPRGRIMLTWLSAVVIFWHVPGVFGWITGGHEFGGAMAQAGALEYILSGLLSLVGAFSATGLSMIAYVLRPEVVTTILMGGEGEIVYVMWTMVRDLLNLAFILILLFSAFATIFQVQKYNLRSLLLKLVLMAIFVNFSLPIARVIIDASNIIMYYFINILFAQAHDPGIDVGIKIIQSMNIAEIIIPKGTETESATVLFFGVIFTLIVGIFTIAIGGILIVRLVALAILMIFSPIAFVANILPSTQNFANDWWSNLFKYAFVGPILIFFLFFSTVFMAQMNNMAFMKKDAQGAKSATSLIDTTKNIGADESSWIATISFNMIPIIILYMGIMSSMKMGGAAGTFIAGAAGGALKKMARSGAGVIPVTKFVGSRADHYVLGAAGSRAVNKTKEFFGLDKPFADKYKERAASSAIMRSTEDIREFGKKAAEAAKNMDKLSNFDLHKVVKSGNKVDRAAAAKQLAENGALADPAKLKEVLSAVGQDRLSVQVVKSIESSMKKQNQRGALATHYSNDRANHKYFDDKSGEWKSFENDQKVFDKFLKVAPATLAQQSTENLNTSMESKLDVHIQNNITTNKDAQHVYKADNFDSDMLKKIKHQVGVAGNAAIFNS